MTRAAPSLSTLVMPRREACFQPTEWVAMVMSALYSLCVRKSAP